MKHLNQIMHDYQIYHTKQITKYTHFIGVPMIIFSLMIVASWVSITVQPSLHISLLWLCLIIAVFYYIKLDFTLGVVLSLIMLILAFLAAKITQYTFTKHSAGTFIVLFTLGWIIQLIGHYYEGRKPALVDNFLQVFSAPIFLVWEIAVMLGLRKNPRL